MNPTSTPSPPFRLARLRAHAAFAAALGVGLLLTDATVGALIRLAPERLPLPSKYVWDEFVHVGGQIAGLEAVMADSDTSPAPAYGVVIGTSSVRAGVDPLVLEQSDGELLRWLVLAGGGPDFLDLAYLIRPLSLLKTPPRLIVLGLHRFLLVNQSWRPEYTIELPAVHPIISAIRVLVLTASFEISSRLATPGPAAGSLLESMRDAGKSAGGFLRDNFALTRSKDFVRIWARHLSYRLRFQIFRRLHPSPIGLFPSLPYTTTPSGGGDVFMDGPDLAVAGQFMRNRPVEALRAEGRLAASNYRVDGYNARGLARLIEGLLAREAPLVIVLMPELSVVRDAQPARADEVLRQVIQNHAPPAGIRVIDLSASMEDPLFTDFAHVTEGEGRRAFSSRLGQALRQPLRELLQSPHRKADPPARAIGTPPAAP